jgi:RNA polymerase sigma-70 factor (ECF subfamily)
MGAAQRGDRAAYDRLLRAIPPYVRQIASYHHRKPELVDDVVQDVLLTLHRVRHTYDPRRSFRHWLGTIARRRSIDALRRRHYTLVHETSAEAVGLAYEGYADPAAELFSSAYATADHLQSAIDHLPAVQREAVRLLKLRQLDLAEASAIAGRSIGALKVAAHRALRSLRDQLQPG